VGCGGTCVLLAVYSRAWQWREPQISITRVCSDASSGGFAPCAVLISKKDFLDATLVLEDSAGIQRLEVLGGCC
jgi:hypothetical protein